MEDPKDPDSSIPFQLLTHFADADKVADVRKRLEAGGMGWGDLKKELFEAVDTELGPKRARYEELMASETELDDILASGLDRARERARRVLKDVRSAIGIG